MLQFREDSYCYLLLQLIALSGEFPYHFLDMMDGNDRIIKRNILNMKKEGYITILGKGQSKTIRITKKAFEPLSKMGQCYLEHYMFMSSNHRFRGGKDSDRIVWRNHRLAEIMLMLQYINCKLWIFEKPALSLSEKNISIQNDEILFYNSREIKNADVEQRYKTEFTRIMGMLFSPGGIYGIYNTNRGLMKWNRQGEGKAQVLMEDIASYNYNGSHPNINSAIMFGKDIMTAAKILESNGGLRDSNDFEMLSFDNTYENIHFIPLDDHGIYQLTLITQRGWQNAINSSIFPQNYMNTENLPVECDAYDGKSKFILSFLDGNIGKLKRFKEATYSKGEFEVVCFDWQTQMVTSYLKDNATIKEVTEDKLSGMIKETFS